MTIKKKIVEQSIQLFEMKGFSETSIQDVVEALGVTKGTFYYYFESKEQLLKDIHLIYIDELLKLQEEIIKNLGTSYKTKLFEIVRIMITQIKITGSRCFSTMGKMSRLFPLSWSPVLCKPFTPGLSTWSSSAV
ncbi:TetR/AcrR family transcriptional regulator [Melghirimyces algeriensis]|uniref:Transcriptional regulator, TetR family n=1 Tax=Melghirimyces algeriensis TaxID=910412 RepID=A0A521FHN5_9BACL|nr:transcriptional regulator, TetR family [Melghirimyces algeriensis]